VLDLVPFTGARRVMGDDDFQSGRGGESREFVFPEPGSVSVGSAAVGCDEDSAGVGILLFAHVLPPLFDGGDGEDRGVMVDAHGDPGAVVSQVVDSVGNNAAKLRRVFAGQVGFMGVGTRGGRPAVAPLAQALPGALETRLASGCRPGGRHRPCLVLGRPL
jgi:hypothetical protein